MAKTTPRGRAGTRAGGSREAAPRTRRGRAAAGTTTKDAKSYLHEQTAPMRPDVGTQAQFRKKRPPTTWRYDSSLSPSLEWDGQNGTRELGENG